MVAADAVGVNLEDTEPAHPGVLSDVDEQCARLAAARVEADAGRVHRFVNARSDVWFGADVAPDARLDEARRRARAYADAGADGIFLPGIDERATRSTLD